jgi:lipoprotein-anchoring transpeptidase ErfK/SrfK
MGQTSRVAAACFGATLGVLATALPALAAPEAVTLSASRTTVEYGQSTQLSGTVSPPAGGQTVAIVDEASGQPVAHAATGADGTYSLVLTPDRNLRVNAAWRGKASASVDLGVRPLVSVALSDVHLFGTATASGHIEPAVDGSVAITIFRRGAMASQVEGLVASAGAFAVELPIERPGAYRAEATFAHDSYLPATAGSATRRTPLPRLREGSRSVHVRLLEERLRQLHYRVPSPNTRFDYRTGDAVLAFRKVQGMSRTKTVTPATWRALAAPRIPKPRARTPRTHIEVDQTRQVLYVVREGEIAHIVHVSTGGPGIGTTRDGVWRVWLKFPGYSPLGLFMPSFFDGGRAIHGWPDVPPTPASHGCVRVPNWTAVWMYRQIAVGSQIRVYHS